MKDRKSVSALPTTLPPINKNGRKLEELLNVHLLDSPNTLRFIARDHDYEPSPLEEQLHINRAPQGQQAELTPAMEHKVTRAVQRVVAQGEWAELIFPDERTMELFVYPSDEFERAKQELNEPILTEALLSRLPKARRGPRGEASTQ
jgi:hypothetical protein